jgi:hypothetical protein
MRSYFRLLVVVGVASGTSGCVSHEQRYSSNSPDTIQTVTRVQTEPMAATPPSNETLTPTSNRPDSPNRIYSTPDEFPSPTSSNTATRIYSEAPTAPSSPASPEPVDRGGALSPQDQATSENDRAMVMQIRQSMMNDTAMAAAAPSIKVTVNNGKVTLAGEVKSESEKANLGNLAQRTAGVVSVDNQLEVKAGHP